MVGRDGDKRWGTAGTGEPDRRYRRIPAPGEHQHAINGPSLAGFGLSGTLASPVLTLTGSAGTIATNAGWDNAPVNGAAAAGGTTIQPLTAALSARVGAFALAAGSGDSAIVATLPPGTYTAQVAGANGSTGIALVEVYELR